MKRRVTVDMDSSYFVSVDKLQFEFEDNKIVFQISDVRSRFSFSILNSLEYSQSYPPGLQSTPDHILRAISTLNFRLLPIISSSGMCSSGRRGSAEKRSNSALTWALTGAPPSEPEDLPGFGVICSEVLDLAWVQYHSILN